MGTHSRNKNTTMAQTPPHVPFQYGVIEERPGVTLYSQREVNIKMVRLLYPDAVIVETNDPNTPATEKTKLYTDASQT